MMYFRRKYEDSLFKVIIVNSKMGSNYRDSVTLINRKLFFYFMKIIWMYEGLVVVTSCFKYSLREEIWRTLAQVVLMTVSEKSCIQRNILTCNMHKGNQ